MSAQDKEQMLRLHAMGFGTRQIALKLGLGRKQVRTTLTRLGRLQPRKLRRASHLDLFREQIAEKVKKDLTATRILRELQTQGYRGGRTILADYIRSLRATPQPRKKVWRRFETEPGEEMQFDWSPYRVSLGNTLRVVHAFAATLGYCRKSFVRFYFDERQSTMLQAHVEAFSYFGGVARRGVYDRMATVVLGTVGPDRKPQWHPRFLDFTRHYGYDPYLCKVCDPDRKGKDERVFWYLERDFVRGSEFESIEHLNAQCRLWLDDVANQRVHGTTRRVPNEAWEQERPFLIALPNSPFPACDEEGRSVGPDATISVRGTPYIIPPRFAHRNVIVRLYAEHFEVLDERGKIAFSRKYAPEAEKGRLDVSGAQYDPVRPRGPHPGGTPQQLEEALLKRFPVIAPLCEGIRARMKALCHVHLRALWRLADTFGDDAFLDAAKRAQHARRFSAQSVRRILERDHPLPKNSEPQSPLHAAARVLFELGDVDGGSLGDYAALDQPEDGEHHE